MDRLSEQQLVCVWPHVHISHKKLNAANLLFIKLRYSTVDWVSSGIEKLKLFGLYVHTQRLFDLLNVKC